MRLTLENITEARAGVITAFNAERDRQNKLFPNQHLPNGTSADTFKRGEIESRRRVEEGIALGTLTWTDLFMEETYEVLAEEDRPKLRVELLQVMAICGRWVEDLDREERDEMCCEPDYDYENGQYVHHKGCWGSVEANAERDEQAAST